MKRTRSLLSLLILPLIPLIFVACSSANKSSSPKGTTYEGHGAGSIPPEVVARYAPAALDPQITRRIQSMLDLKAPGLGMVTPDAKRLFFGWSVSGTPQIWRVNGPQAFPQQMTGGSDTTTISDITPDGKWVVIERDRNGEENPGLYLQDTNGGALKEVFHKTGVRAELSWIADDSRSLYYSANDQKPDVFTLYRYDFTSGQRQEIFNEPGLWSLADVSKDRKTFLMVKLTGSFWREYSLLDLATKKLTPILGQGEQQEYDMSFGARPGEYFVSTNKFGDFRRLYTLKDGKFKPISKEKPYDVAGFKTDDAKRRLILSWNELGFTRVEALDAQTLQPIHFPTFQNADQIYAGSFTRDGRYITIGVETSQAPRTSYVYDFNNKKLTQWVLPSSPEIDTTKFSRATLEFYPARDGTKVPMFVRRPAKCAKQLCPVVVLFHGGPESQSKPGFSGRSQLFIDAGFIYAEPNVRGSDGYGKTWLTSDDGPKRLAVITDIEDAARYIRKSWAVGGVAPKVGIFGGSYGGYATLVGMTMFAGAYDAGVAVVGMSNLVTFLKNTAPYRRQLRISEYGDPDKDLDALVKLSPITYLDKVKAPLLIIQGVSDPRVPAGEAVQMQEAMQKKGLKSNLILFPDEGHGSVKRENQVLEIGHTLSFFQEHLGGGGVTTTKK